MTTNNFAADFVLGSAANYAAGYLLTQGTGNGHLGGTICLISTVAHAILNLISVEIVKQTSGKVSHAFLAKAATAALVGVATITTLVANKLIGDLGLVLCGAYYAYFTADNLAKAYKISQLDDRFGLISR